VRVHKKSLYEKLFPSYPARLPEDIRIWARKMRGNMTNAEALLWMLLRNRRIANSKFRRQHPIGRYILDFYCADKKLCIELDGSQHMETIDRDEDRNKRLYLLGIKVLRFWNNEVLVETEAVLEKIYQALTTDTSANTLTPTPLPQAGEGG
jgi:adenine-specific DNA-methyltransferase